MSAIVKKYYKGLSRLLRAIRVTDKDCKLVNFYEGLEAVAKLIIAHSKSGNKIIFIGNGASAAISSHMSTDFWKNGGIRAMAFNDASLLTCVSNDFSYEEVFSRPMQMFADRNDILFAISSSGKSKNILVGVRSALSKGCKVITISGFSKNNPLCKLGDFNFHVPSHSYGPVEIIHHSICHCILETALHIRPNTKTERYPWIRQKKS